MSSLHFICEWREPRIVMTLFWPSCCRRLFRFCHILITRSFSVCGSDGTWELSHYRLSIVYSIIGESLIAPDKVELTDEAAGKQTISVARIPSRHHQPSQSTTTVTDSIVPRRSLTWKSMQHPRRQRQTVPIAIIISCFAVSSLRLVPVSPTSGVPEIHINQSMNLPLIRLSPFPLFLGAPHQDRSAGRHQGDGRDRGGGGGDQAGD